MSYDTLWVTTKACLQSLSFFFMFLCYGIILIRQLKSKNIQCFLKLLFLVKIRYFWKESEEILIELSYMFLFISHCFQNKTGINVEWTLSKRCMKFACIIGLPIHLRKVWDIGFKYTAFFAWFVFKYTVSLVRPNGDLISVIARNIGLILEKTLKQKWNSGVRL